MALELLTYADVLSSCPKKEGTHALLGNGFSRACRNEIFAYDALFDRADFAALSPHAKKAFAALKTTDFEVVMNALRDSSSLLQLYDPSQVDLAQLMESDAVGLRDVLVSAIAGSHPERPDDIPEASYGCCREFLQSFKNVYTLNYDLLLYWAYMQDELEPALSHDDGFRKPDYDCDAEYVVWEPEYSNRQTIYYLHGALHIFDTGTEIQKFTWANTGIRLIEQIRNALEADKYPLFVAEGSSQQKKTRIRHSDFLSKGTKSMRAIKGSLVVYGHSLAKNDAHVLSNVVRSGLKRAYVGIFGDPESPTNQEVVANANALAARRPESRPLEIAFFDSETATIW